MRRFPVIVGAVTCTLALAASPGVSGAAGNAQATYKAALAYAATQNVHYVSKATQGAAVLSVTGDTSPTAGTQSLIVKSTQEARNGEIVVVLAGTDESTDRGEILIAEREAGRAPSASCQGTHCCL